MLVFSPPTSLRGSVAVFLGAALISLQSLTLKGFSAFPSLSRFAQVPKAKCYMALRERAIALALAIPKFDAMILDNSRNRTSKTKYNKGFKGQPFQQNFSPQGD